MANLSARIGLTPVEQETTQELAYTTSIQNVVGFSSNEDVVEGDLFVTDASGSYRTSVRLVIVKNGLGTYEVAVSDLAGDDILGNPLAVFSMSGSTLRITLDSAFSSITRATLTYYIRTPSLYRTVSSPVNVLTKEDANSYTASQSGLLNISTLPIGYYRVSIWADKIVQGADDSVLIKPQLNAAAATPVGYSTAWEVGLDSSANISGETGSVKNLMSTKILQVSGSPASFNLDVVITGTSGNSSIDRVGYSIESIPGFNQITTEWN